jgi:hypothetical protein
MSRRAIILGAATLCVLGSSFGCNLNDLSQLTPLSGDCPKVEDPSTVGTGTPLNPTEPTSNIDVSACSAGLSQADVDRNLQMVERLNGDYHEMVVCGGLARGFSYTLSHYFAALSCGEASYPSGFQYQGSGLYYVGGVMLLQAKLAKDTSFGKAGDDVPFDLFAQESYGDQLGIKAEIKASASWNPISGGQVNTSQFMTHLDGSIELTIVHPKPANLEMWGIKATDGQPVKTQQEALAKAIGENVVFFAEINAESSQGTKYHIKSPELKVADMYNGTLLELPVDMISAEDAEINQKVSLVSWDMDFIPTTNGDLNGSITVKVDGGKFPYYVRYSYPKRSTPDVLVSCTAPPPPP